MSKNLSKIVFLFIVALAFYLRLNGITNGFPYIFHPDEPTIVRSALGIRFYFNPGHFDWPHLYIYVNYFVYMGFAQIRNLLVNAHLKDTVSAIFPLIWNDNLIFYLLTRILTAVLGALTIIPVYLTAKKLFGEKAGILAALAFALIPFHVRHSHYSLPDAPMVFLLSWAIYYASSLLTKNDPLHYAGSGLYLGLSASTKYNGGLSFFMVPLAHIMRSIKNKESILTFSGFMNLVLSAVVAIIGFIIGTPFAVIDYHTFLRDDGPSGALWQFKNVGSVTLLQRPEKFVNEMVFRVAQDVGYTFLLGFFIVILILIAKVLTKKIQTVDYYAWFIVITGAILLFYISGFERSRSHYYMISYPFIAIAFGYFGSQLFTYLESKRKAIVVLFLVILYIIPLYFAAKESFTFASPDTRNILDTWMTQNVNKTDTIVYNSQDVQQVVVSHGNQQINNLDALNTVNQGYLVLSYDTNLGNDAFTVLKYGSQLKEQFTISRDFHNGPNITVYLIKK